MGARMLEAFAIQILIYTHVTALALWFGGLFGYVAIVWPAIISEAAGRFPRALLARIAIRTAPWIYGAMACALLTYAGIWLGGGIPAGRSWIVAYGLILVTLVANNVYGSVVAWPRMMLLPFEDAGRVWFWFRVRMSASLVVGLALYSVAICFDWNRR